MLWIYDGNDDTTDCILYLVIWCLREFLCALQPISGGYLNYLFKVTSQAHTEDVMLIRIFIAQFTDVRQLDMEYQLLQYMSKEGVCQPVYCK